MVVMPILEGRSRPEPLGTIGIYLLLGSGALSGVMILLEAAVGLLGHLPAGPGR